MANPSRTASNLPGPGGDLPWMRVHALAGMKNGIRFGPRINAAIAAKPDGLLLQKSIFLPAPPHRNASVSARFRRARRLGGFGAPLQRAAEFSSRHRRRRLLARELPPPRRVRGGVSGYAGTIRVGCLRARSAGPRRHVIGAPPSRPPFRQRRSGSSPPSRPPFRQRRSGFSPPSRPPFRQRRSGSSPPSPPPFRQRRSGFSLPSHPPFRQRSAVGRGGYGGRWGG